VVLFGVATIGCGNELAPVDFAESFLGYWECGSGQREMDCGQGGDKFDLVSRHPDVMRFERGTATNLVLQVPSSVIVPGVPGGPICELAFDAYPDFAFLHAESICSDDQGERVVVAQGEANNSWRPGIVYLDTDSTTSNGCRVKTSAHCYAQQ
jgi:hypothetical protein